MEQFLNKPLFELLGRQVSGMELLIAGGIVVLSLIVLFVVKYLAKKWIYSKINLPAVNIRLYNRIIALTLFAIAAVAVFEVIIPQFHVYNHINQILNFQLFKVGEYPISIAAFLKLFIILILFAVVSRILRDMVLVRFFSYMKIDPGTQFTFSRVIHYLIMVVGVVFGFQTIGIDLSGLAVIFGFLSVGIGFGLQNITSNFVAGLILLFERPINVGDRVQIGDLEGDIDEIKIRATRIQTVDNISIIVPNSEFVSSNVINYSHGDPKIRINIDVGVSYNSDLDLVLRTLKEIAKEEPEVLNKPEPDVLLRNFGDSSWDMRLRVWISNPKRHPIVRSKINCAIVKKFRERNIEIPFPQRDINFRTALQTMQNGEIQKESEPNQNETKDA
jgi:small-conductance mechanosensitive channel